MTIAMIGKRRYISWEKKIICKDIEEENITGFVNERNINMKIYRWNEKNQKIKKNIENNRNKRKKEKK